MGLVFDAFIAGRIHIGFGDFIMEKCYSINVAMGGKMNVRLNDEEMTLLNCAKKMYDSVKHARDAADQDLNSMSDMFKAINESRPDNFAEIQDQAYDDLLKAVGVSKDNEDHQYLIFIKLLPIITLAVPLASQVLFWKYIMNPSPLMSMIFQMQVNDILSCEIAYHFLSGVETDEDGWVTGYKEIKI